MPLETFVRDSYNIPIGSVATSESGCMKGHINAFVDTLCRIKEILALEPTLKRLNFDSNT